MSRRALTQIQTIAIAVVVIAIIGGLWYYTQTPTPTPSPTPTPTPSKTPTPTATPTPTPTPSPTPSPTPGRPPIAVASSTMTFAKVGDNIGFTAEGSKALDGQLVSYKWSMGDGSSATGLTTNHAYNLPGDYIISLTVVDDRGSSSTNDVSPLFVKVDKPTTNNTLQSPPVSIIAVSKQVASEKEGILFDGSSSHGWKMVGKNIAPDVTKIVDWSWDFGDGIKGAGKSLNHTYSTTGNYLVKLTIKDNTNKTAVTVRTIRVLPPGVKYLGTIKNPDTFVVASALEITSSLDLWRITGGNVGRQICLALSNMLVFTGQGDIAPKAEGSLSEKWELSPDGLHYTFYLRKGVKFWNGDELKAEDVEYTYERIMALSAARKTWGLMYERMMGIRPGNPVPDNVIKNAVEVIDNYTVRFNFVKPYAPFLVDLSYPYTGIIQKKHAIANGAWNWGDPRDFSAIDGVDKPMEDGIALMCTGPFMVEEWIKGERMVFKRNDNYWQRPAKIKYVRMITVIEWSTRSLMMRVGDLDGITVPSPVEFEQSLGEKGVTPIQVKYAGFVETIYFGVKFDPAKQPPENQVPSDFFADVHMRRAFAYAFPYEKYIKEVFLGYAEAAKGVLPSGWLGSYQNYPYTYNLTKAAEELKQTKYWDSGFQVVAGCQVWAIATHGRAYQMLAQELAKINPKFKLIVVQDKWADMLLRPMGMLVGVIGLDPVWYRNIYHSQYGFESSYGWKNDRVDELIVKQTETPFIEERLPMIKEAMDIVAQEAPVILTVYTPKLALFRDYIGGYWYQVNHIVDFGYWPDITKGS